MESRLASFGAQWLLEESLISPEWLVEDLIPTCSTIIFAAPPKYGKSWFCLQLGHAVATGTSFLGHQTKTSGVLYLGLEDRPFRLQHRLLGLTDESTDNFRLAVASAKLGNGLIEQLEQELTDFPQTKLIIIDTLQVIRGAGKDYSYQADYSVMREIKSFADSHSVACLVVHHTRKSQCTTDEFMDVSGTTGLTGACDEMFVLKRDSRNSTKSVLSVTGRDIDQAELILQRENNLWICLEEKTEADIRELAIPNDVKATVTFMQNRTDKWQGTASALLSELGIEGLQPHVLSAHLNCHREYLLDHAIVHTRSRVKDERRLILEFNPPEGASSATDDADDADDAVSGEGV